MIAGTLTQIDPVANDSGTFGAKVRVNGDAGDLLIGIQAKVEIVNGVDLGQGTGDHIIAGGIDVYKRQPPEHLGLSYFREER